MFFFKNKEKSQVKEDITQLSPQELIVQKLLIDQEAERINKKYQFPASFKKAQLHLKAVKFGYNAPKISIDGQNPTSSYIPTNSSKPRYQAPKVCPCCNQPINTKNISIGYHSTDPEGQKKPFLLNSSASLFFSFIKMSILYLLLVFMICGAFNLLTSVDGNYCHSHPQVCTESIFELISTYNKHQDQRQKLMLKIQNILCLIAVIGSIIFFTLYKRIRYHIYEAIDAQHQTQDDYTLFVENIPILDFKPNINANDMTSIDFDYEQNLKKIFESEIESWIEWMKDQNHQPGSIEQDLIEVSNKKGKSISELQSDRKVTTISLCFNLGQLQRINQQRQLLMQQQIDSYNKDGSNSESKEQIDNQIKVLNQIEVNLCKKFASDNSITFNVTHFVGKGLVSFEYQHFREYIMQKYEDGSKEFKYGNNKLVLSRASHPTDINWFNMKVSDQDRLKKIIVSYVIIIMILVFSAAALIGIDFVKLKGIKQGKHIETETVVFNYCLNIMGSVIAAVINTGIWYVIRNLTQYQRHKTVTKKVASQIIKTLIAQFINTVFIFYLIQLFNQRPYLSSAGLVVQASTVIVVSGFISILTDCINFPYWLRYITLWWKYSYITDREMQSRQTIPTYQVKFNKDYELPVFNLTGRYDKYLLQIYMCMFYCYLVPVGVLASCVIFAVLYWIDKVKMFRLSSQYQEMGYFLSRVIFKLFQGSLLAFTVGNLIFSSAIYGQSYVDPINIASLIIAFIYTCFIALAPPTLDRKVFAKYETFENISYTQCLINQKFVQTYWTENPATVFAKQVDINDKSRFIQQKIVQQYFGDNQMLNFDSVNYNEEEFVEELVDNSLQEREYQN